MKSLFYGAWIVRASDGGFVAQLADFPEITAIGLNQKGAAMLASIRLSAHVAALDLDPLGKPAGDPGVSVPEEVSAGAFGPCPGRAHARPQTRSAAPKMAEESPSEARAMRRSRDMRVACART